LTFFRDPYIVRLLYLAHQSFFAGSHQADTEAHIHAIRTPLKNFKVVAQFPNGRLAPHQLLQAATETFCFKPALTFRKE
jgi:hypothetical protein